jgi:hypothetical protein
MRRIFTSLALLGLLAGCGSTVDAPDVASAGGGGSSAAPTATSDVVTRYVAAVGTFVHCLRDEGLNVPDPGPRGEIDYSALGPNPKKDPKFLAAQQKCAGLLPPVPKELEAKQPPMTPLQIARAREYAKCVRAHGLPDFPDPDAEGHWPDRNPDPNHQMTDEEAHRSFLATQTCVPVLDGRPPASPDPNASAQG